MTFFEQRRSNHEIRYQEIKTFNFLDCFTWNFLKVFNFCVWRKKIVIEEILAKYYEKLKNIEYWAYTRLKGLLIYSSLAWRPTYIFTRIMSFTNTERVKIQSFILFFEIICSIKKNHASFAKKKKTSTSLHLLLKI